MEREPRRENDPQIVWKPKAVAGRVASFIGGRSNAEKAIALLLFLLAFLLFVPEMQVRYFAQGAAREDIPTLVNEYRKTWAQIIGGFFVLLGLYFTWRRVEISQKTLETQQDQQVTERFTRAIDQLGATDDDGKPKLEIRLGGIYALERIARDSPERDYSTVMEILTAYVRANAPYSPEKIPVPGTTPNEVNEQEEPPADIRAILEVIGRREENRTPGENRILIDLRRTNLAGTNLNQADLRGADLRGASLYRAKLREANLEGANLSDADLRSANFAEANFRNSELQRADIRGANFREADFEEALLASANLFGTFLPGANLMGATLFGANLERTLLEGTNVVGANFQQVRGLIQQQLWRTHGDATTKLPEGFTRPAR